MNSVLKKNHFVDVHIDKKVVLDSFELIDDQARWMEQKLTMKIDNIILGQFIQHQEKINNLDRRLNEDRND